MVRKWLTAWVTLILQDASENVFLCKDFVLIDLSEGNHVLHGKSVVKQANGWLSPHLLKHLVEDKELGVGGGGGTQSCAERGGFGGRRTRFKPQPCHSLMK